MATNSAYNEIKRKITSSKRGTLFFPDSFAQMASSDAIRSALVRLCKDGDIIRVAQGIYCYPKIDTNGEAELYRHPLKTLPMALLNVIKLELFRRVRMC